MQCHEKPGNRGTWLEHSIDGWFLGSSLRHYRAFRCYIRKTQARRVCDTVQFLHKHITRPALTEADAIVKAAGDLRAALKGKQNWVGDKQVQDLRKLSSVFTDIAEPPETEPRISTRHPEALAPRVPTPRVLSPRVGASSDNPASSIKPAQENIVEAGAESLRQ